MKELKHSLGFLDGLRGILCLIVVVDHSVGNFMPNLKDTYLPGISGSIRYYIGTTPLNIIYSGTPSVCLFFIMSGFVLTYKFHQTQDVLILTKGAIKRYFRFVIPIAASYILLYFCYYPYFGLQRIIIEAIYKVEFSFESVINGPLWTIVYEVYGSFLIFAIASLFGLQKQKYRLLIYFILFVYNFISNYSFFIFGLIVCDLYVSQGNKIKLRTLPSIIIFCLGLWFVTYPYPQFNIEIGRLYHIFNFTGNRESNYQWCMHIGAFLIFTSIIFTDKFKSFLENKFFLFMGKISFPVYLLHMIILTAIRRVWGDIHNPLHLVVGFILCVTITTIIAIPFERYIDQWGIWISSKIANKIVN